MTNLKKAAMVAKRVSLSENFENLVSGVFNLYLQKFEYEGFSFNDVVEVESIKMSGEVEALFQAHLKRIETLVSDEKSDVSVYTDALFKIIAGEMSHQEFMVAKNGCKVLTE